jgi:hypothetical protein
MKSWQIAVFVLSLLLLVPIIFATTYNLWAFSPRLALAFEFIELGAFVFAWFTLLDRTISRA